uniref:DUF4136 domain-containing protein n=1 Tax=Altererythrobacter segetis TaxID=1104773 RepID=UPI00140C21ED|nr:DUF4136 domain-containing protein [Altererythrobacter segetis]
MTRLMLASISAALLLSGCAQTYVSPVSVTRFLGPAPARLGMGPIAVRAAPGTANSLEFAPYWQAVSAELTRLGYQVVAGNDAAQVAEVRVERAVDQPGRKRNPVSFGLGGSTGSYGSGLGMGLGIDLSGPPPAIADNRIGVIIRDGASGQPLWEGRAEFAASANSKYGSAQAAAAKMVAALFAGFPGRSGETIEVR